MKPLAFAPFVLLATTTAAQNLVANPSFEQLDTCTNPLDGVEFATFWYAALNTPDLFNTCSTSLTGVPNNFCGYQLPATGNGYAGMAAYENVPGTTLLHHEIMCIQLTQPLIIGHVYHGSMRASATTATVIGGGDSRFASNNLGMLCLMECGHHTLNSNSIINHAHVWTAAILSDSLNWSTIEGDFTADSAYQYVAIGNFFGDGLTDAQDLFPSAETQGSYYYVDDVSVTYSMNQNSMGADLTLSGLNAFYDVADGSIVVQGGSKGALVTVHNAEGQRTLLARLDESTTGAVIPFSSPAAGLYVLTARTSTTVRSIKFVVNE